MVMDSARAAFTGLGEQGLVDAACDALLETGDPGLAGLVKAAGYWHSDGPRDAVASFLTGDVERYRRLDATGAALREVHDRGDDMLRFHLAERARDETCLEWVQAVVGGRPSGQFAVVTDRDWSTITGILGATGRWESLWRLVFAAPPAWGTRMLRMLDEAQWTPVGPEEQRAFVELRALTRASRAVLDCGWVPADPTRLPGVEGSVRSLVVTPDGSRVCVCTDRGVGLWELPSAAAHGAIPRDRATGWRLAVTPDSKLLAVEHRVYRPWPISAPGGVEEAASLWQLPSGKPAGVLGGHVDSPNTMLITQDGQFLVVGDRTGRIHLWRLPSGTPAGTLAGADRAVNSLATSYDGRLLACAHTDGTITLWQLADHVLIDRVDFGRHAPEVVAVSDWGTLVASCGGLLKVWDVAVHGRKPKILGSVGGEAVATPGGSLVVGSGLNGVHAWRLPVGAEDRLIPFQGSKPVRWRTLGGGELLAGFGSGSCGVQLWRLPGCSVGGILADETQNFITHLSATASGSTIVTADFDGVVTLWRLWDGRLRFLSQLPLADIDFADIQRPQRPAAELLSGERLWRDLLMALARWRDHPQIAAYDRRWDPTDTDAPESGM
ncbi:WD40 repeat domain-containing protein [Streptomyces sp. WAC 06725]|uniref:WD40 repeat domain-containing protein n=1 Tax=Streptomyces sp. WAC 06725 TaxID=2203209 RepID=UPI00163C5350|nr:hypothetical protein [Streptomyces sp. WAC 06725]